MSLEREFYINWLREAAILGILLLLALVLRVYAIDRSALWTDEMFSLQSSAGRGFYVEQIPRGEVLDPAPRPTSLEGPPPKGSFWGVYGSMATDTHPPLYFMVLRLWRDVFPDTTAWLRGPSVIASVVTVAAMYWAFAASFHRRAGITAGLLTALSTLQIQYAQEVRDYAQGTAFTALAAAALLRIESRGWTLRRGFALGASAVLGVCSLYLVALPLLAMGVYSLLALRAPDRRADLRKVLLTGAVAGCIATLLLAPLLLQQRTHVGGRNQWLVSEEPRRVLAVGSDVALSAYQQIAPPTPASQPLAIAGALLVAIVSAWLWVRVPRSRIWTLWTLSSLGLLAAWDLWANKVHLHFDRYTVFAGPGVIGLLVSCIGMARVGPVYRWMAAVPLAAILLAFVSLTQAYQTNKVPWFGVTQYAQRGNIKPTDIVLVASTSNRQWEHILYLGLDRYVPTPFAAIVMDSRASTDLARVRAEAEKRGGLVLFAEGGLDLSEAIPPGWKRTGLLNVESVGLLQTYRPN